HECDALPVGMSDLGGDRIGKSIGHAGKIAGETMNLSFLDRNVTCPPRRDRSTVAADNRVFAQSHAEFMCDDLRLHRYITTRGTVMHDFAPVFHTFLRFFQEASVSFPFKTR